MKIKLKIKIGEALPMVPQTMNDEELIAGIEAALSAYRRNSPEESNINEEQVRLILNATTNSKKKINRTKKSMETRRRRAGSFNWNDSSRISVRKRRTKIK